VQQDCRCRAQTARVERQVPSDRALHSCRPKPPLHLSIDLFIMSSLGSSLNRAACPARSDRCAVARATPEQRVKSAAAGLLSATLLMVGTQDVAHARPALAPPAPPTPEEQRALVEAQKAKLEGLLKKQMELSAPVCPIYN
jgi:hypothetical protein